MSPGTMRSIAFTAKRPLAAERALVRRPSDVRLVQRDTQGREARGLRAERAGADLGGHALEDRERQELRRGVAAAEQRLIVEVAEIERREHPPQRVARAADVDNDAVAVELLAFELDVDHVGGAVQALRGT